MTDDRLIQPEKDSVTYSSYLKVDDLLSLQTPLSSPHEHDETLFIVIHQVYELWFKQLMHEVEALSVKIQNNELMPFIRLIRRMNTIQTVLTHQVDILETMTPVDFNRFRSQLNPASGFQSYQFRIFEFRMGLRDKAYLKFYRNHPKHQSMLEEALSKPSIYEMFIGFLSRKGFDVPSAGNQPEPYKASEKVCDAIEKIYRDSDNQYDLYLACEALIEFDERFLLWRYRHVAMVERMIGDRMGTGGSSGAKYLSATLSKRFFPELWHVRGRLGSPYGMRQDLPTD